MTDLRRTEEMVLGEALSRTGSRSGGIFCWDSDQDALRLELYAVDGVLVDAPGLLLRVRRDGRPNGIALWVQHEGRPYLCNDTSADIHYSPYLLEAASIAAAPLLHRGRSIGVLSVSSEKPGAYSPSDLDHLESIAARWAVTLGERYRAAPAQEERPFFLRGLCDEWHEVERRVDRVAGTEVPVLIRGESGTGKERVAREIHAQSRRRNGPLITVNCAAIPESLLESTLFGHEKGAFTGAVGDRVGEIRRSDGGTLFLDEVGDLARPLQGKVLRAIENGEVQPVGSDRAAERVDVRILCATNRNLREMVEQKFFREDLYHRVSVVELELPALRSYRHRLAVLGQVFLRRAARIHGRRLRGIRPEAIQALSGYDFPGNLRELKNIVEHAVVMAEGEWVRLEDLPSAVRSRLTPVSKSPPTLREFRETSLAPVERDYLVDVLRRCAGNVVEAASLAGVNTATLYRLMRRRGIRRNGG